MTNNKRVFREGDIVGLYGFIETYRKGKLYGSEDWELVGLSLSRIKEIFDIMLKNIEQEHRYFLEIGEWKDKHDKALFFDHLQITLREVERMKKEVFEGVE